MQVVSQETVEAVVPRVQVVVTMTKVVIAAIASGESGNSGSSGTTGPSGGTMMKVGVVIVVQVVIQK